MKSKIEPKPNRKARRRQGASLATVLVVTTLVLTCAFTVVGIAYNHLSLTSRSNTVQQAHNLAEAALARGIEKVVSNNTWGQVGVDNSTVQVFFPGAPDGSYGVMAFDPTLSAANGVAQSYNNFGHDTGITINGFNIPADSVHLVGKGYCSGATKTVEATIYVPRFPYAMGSSGSIASGGGLTVASLAAGGDPSNTSSYRPGSLVSNANGSTSVDFSSATNVTIYGDLQTVGGASVGNATIKGEQRVGAAVQQLPTLDIGSYDPQGKPGLQMVTTSSSTPISGYNKANQSLSYTNGLNLANGVLYVNGDLTVSGGITGTGAVIVNGSLTVTGSSSLLSDNQVGLVSRGDMSLQGTGSGNQCINGLIYSEGSISASNATLQGAVISNNATLGSGGINVTNAQIMENPTAAVVNFSMLPNLTVPDSGTPQLMTQVTALSLSVGLTPTSTPQPPTISYALNVSNPAPYNNTGTYQFPVTATAQTPLPAPYQGMLGTVYAKSDATAPNGYSYQPYSGTAAPLGLSSMNVTINNQTFVASDPAAATYLQQQLYASLLAALPANSPPGQLANLNSFMAVVAPAYLSQTHVLGVMLPSSTFSSAMAQTEDLLTQNNGVMPTNQVFNIDLGNDTILPRSQQMRVLYWKDDQ
jgi:hypothetical protein